VTALVSHEEFSTNNVFVALLATALSIANRFVWIFQPAISGRVTFDALSAFRVANIVALTMSIAQTLNTSWFGVFVFTNANILLSTMCVGETSNAAMSSNVANSKSGILTIRTHHALHASLLSNITGTSLAMRVGGASHALTVRNVATGSGREMRTVRIGKALRTRSGNGIASGEVGGGTVAVAHAVLTSVVVHIATRRVDGNAVSGGGTLDTSVGDNVTGRERRRSAMRVESTSDASLASSKASASRTIRIAVASNASSVGHITFGAQTLRVVYASNASARGEVAGGHATNGSTVLVRVTLDALVGGDVASTEGSGTLGVELTLYAAAREGIARRSRSRAIRVGDALYTSELRDDASLLSDGSAGQVINAFDASVGGGGASGFSRDSCAMFVKDTSYADARTNKTSRTVLVTYAIAIDRTFRGLARTGRHITEVFCSELNAIVIGLAGSNAGNGVNIQTAHGAGRKRTVYVFGTFSNNTASSYSIVGFEGVGNTIVTTQAATEMNTVFIVHAGRIAPGRNEQQVAGRCSREGAISIESTSRSYASTPNSF